MFFALTPSSERERLFAHTRHQIRTNDMGRWIQRKVDGGDVLFRDAAILDGAVVGAVAVVVAVVVAGVVAAVVAGLHGGRGGRGLIATRGATHERK